MNPSSSDPLGFGGVGLSETKILRLPLPPGGFVLESGETLPEIQVAYETYGELSPAKDNAVFICHALTGDAHAAGYTLADTKKPSGWWDNMIGPSRGIDTSRFFVVCANILGGCKGTTGPSSVNPADGRPYGSRFPDFTIGDIVAVHKLFLETLGVPRLAAVVGGSFGGMQALVFSIRYPEFVSRCACIASAASLSSQALAFDIIGRAAVQNDPDWKGGDYYDGAPPAAGLAQARQLAHITYLSGRLMEEKFGRRKKQDLVDASTRWAEAARSPFEVAGYLDHQGDKFVRRFDANSYLCITQAMDLFDLGQDLPTLRKSLAGVRCETLVVSLSGDWLFLPGQSAALASAFMHEGKSVSFFPLDAPAGHDAFLTHISQLSVALRSFLGNPSRGPDADGRTDSPPDTGRNTRPTIAKRDEMDAVLSMIPNDAKKVLDLGCGTGETLSALRHGRPDCETTGVEVDFDRAVQTLHAGHNVLLADIDKDLTLFPDNSFDCALLSETLQNMQAPQGVLREMLRIAPVGIVTFPNFGHWLFRLKLLFGGRMPRTRRLPHQWYNTPNIHICTLKDFLELCKEQGVTVDRVCPLCLHPFTSLLSRLGLANLAASRILVRIKR